MISRNQKSRYEELSFICYHNLQTYRTKIKSLLNIYVCVCACVYLCVLEREREREREKINKIDYLPLPGLNKIVGGGKRLDGNFLPAMFTIATLMVKSSYASSSNLASAFVMSYKKSLSNAQGIS